MTILSFLNEFPDESSCRLHFKLQREKLGIICKKCKCKCKTHYWLRAKHQWQWSIGRARNCEHEHSCLPEPNK